MVVKVSHHPATFLAVDIVVVEIYGFILSRGLSKSRDQRVVWFYRQKLIKVS